MKLYLSQNADIRNKRNCSITYKYLISVNFFKETPVPLTWINCSSNDSSQRIPGPVIKPIMEFIKSLFSQEPGSPIIKVPTARKKLFEKKKRKKLFVSPSLQTHITIPIFREPCSSGHTTEELIMTSICMITNQFGTKNYAKSEKHSYITIHYPSFLAKGSLN